MSLLTITIRSRFQAIHCWPECPYDEVRFLQHPHRHEFHVEVELLVVASREKEFFVCKNVLNSILHVRYSDKDLGSKSCEKISEEIFQDIYRIVGDCVKVSVFEDGENGATYYAKDC